MPSLKLKNHANKVQFKVKLINNESLNQRDINIMNSAVIRGIVIPQISGGKKLVYSLANVVDISFTAFDGQYQKRYFFKNKQCSCRCRAKCA